MLAAISGCTVSPKLFSRVDTTAGQKETDVQYCRIYSNANSGGQSMGGIAGAMEVIGHRNAHFKLCMLDRGYTYIP